MPAGEGAAWMDELLDAVAAEVSGGLVPAGWAEDEIAQAIKRHPDAVAR